MTGHHVVVVGSANYDMFAYVDRFPMKGETMVGKAFETGFGGKGANQAVCARILGAKTAFIGKIGDDHFGALTKQNFQEHDVDITHLSVAPAGVPTGVANIIVEDDGDNSMVLVLGANQEMKGEDIDRAAEYIQGSKILVCQNEVPLERTVEALRLAKMAGVITVFNAAPVVDVSSPCAPALFSLVDIWVVNQSELEALIKDDGLTNEARCEAHFKKCRCLAVIATLGSKGALLCDKSGLTAIPACPVDTVVDTTGAGDAFIASFAVAYVKTQDLTEACKLASKLSAQTVKSRGCQASYSILKSSTLL